MNNKIPRRIITKDLKRQLELKCSSINKGISDKCDSKLVVIALTAVDLIAQESQFTMLRMVFTDKYIFGKSNKVVFSTATLTLLTRIT